MSIRSGFHIVILLTRPCGLTAATPMNLFSKLTTPSMIGECAMLPHWLHVLDSLSQQAIWHRSCLVNGRRNFEMGALVQVVRPRGTLAVMKHHLQGALALLNLVPQACRVARCQPGHHSAGILPSLLQPHPKAP